MPLLLPHHPPRRREPLPRWARTLGVWLALASSLLTVAAQLLGLLRDAWRAFPR